MFALLHTFDKGMNRPAQPSALALAERLQPLRHPRLNDRPVRQRNNEEHLTQWSYHRVRARHCCCSTAPHHALGIRRNHDFVIRRLGNQPPCLAHPVRVILRLHPFWVGGAGGWFVGCSQPTFGRALQVGFKHIGSDFHFKEATSMG